MRQWTPSEGSHSTRLLHQLVPLIGHRSFESEVLGHLQTVVPAASYAVYQTGSGCVPTLFMSSSLGVPDTTRDCWQAYLSGPYLQDRTLAGTPQDAGALVLCHITASEVPPLHRARVYEAHGVAERVSVVQHQQEGLFAINFYRHAHQRPFRDSHLADLESLAPALLSLAQKQIELSGPRPASPARHAAYWQQRLQASGRGLSAREIDVCARLLTGMTQEGIAIDLGLRLPTVKTYRNRAFARLGIHFKSELFALFAR